MRVELCAAAFTLSAALLGQPRPDLTGAWKVNPEKTNYGALPGPRTSAMNVDHKDPNLKITLISAGGAGERAIELVFTTDGKENTNYVGSTVVRTKAGWEGAALVMEHSAGEVIVKDRWTLSEDGKTLTVVRRWSGSEGEGVQTIVCEKQ